MRPHLPAAAVLVLGSLVLSGCGSGSGDDGASPAATGTSGAAGQETVAQGASGDPAGNGSGDSAGAPEADTSTADSLSVVVNKQNPLQPQDYVPSPLTQVEGHQLREDAAGALTEMLSDMRAEGVTVNVTSAYRSYDTQVSTYDHWVQQNGQEAADRVSARPGYSEHQTGLAVDLADGTGCDLQECFADTPAAQWAAENAADYGFVLRFPEGGEEITGYSYEPWHLRYLGVDQAREFQESEATTLEEYYGTGPAPDYP